MEDPRTKSTLDALADLFLTGAPAGSNPSPRPPVNGGHAAAAAQIAARVGPASPLTGPKPIRLAPKIRPAPALTSASAWDGDIAAPAARTAAAPPLRLAEPRRERERETPAATPAPTRAPSPFDAMRLEAVFLGNLPGFGGPWLTQYASYLAKRQGPVAVIHLDDEQADVELVTPGRVPLPQDGVEFESDAIVSLERWAEKLHPRSLGELIDALRRQAPAHVSTWLIHLPSTMSAELVSLARHLERWTVLTGADEAAVAAAQRLLAALLENDPARDKRRIGAMVMGAEEARSLQAADRLRAAGAASSASVELVGWQKQMTPVNLRSLGSFTDQAAIWPALWTLVEDHAGGEADYFHDAVGPGPLDRALTLGEGEDLDAAALDRELSQLDPDDEVSTAQSHARTILGRSRDEDEEETGGLSELIELVDDEEAAAPPRVEAPTPAPVRPTPPRQPVQPSQVRATPRITTLRRAEPATSRQSEIARPAPARPLSAAAERAAFQPSPEPVEAESAAEVEAAASPDPAPVASPAPRQAEPVAPPATPHAAAAAAAEPDLASFLGGGHITLQARSPRHADIVMALDEDGVLHLLHRHASKRARGASRAGDDAGLRAAIVELIEASAWAGDHYDLLKMTQRQLRFADAEPVLHLFTDEAKPAAALASRLGDAIRLHLLQRVKVGDAETWFSTELN